MNQIKILSVVIVVIIATITGCSNISNNLTNQVDKATQYYIVENETKIYYDDANFITYIPDFYSIVNKTIKSFNEVKEGKRNLDFVNKIASKKLIESNGYKLFSKKVPKDTELKIINSNIVDYSIVTLIHNKDENLIKIHISIETEEENENGVVIVKNNQTYVYHIDNNKIKLHDYHLEQHI